MKAFNHILFNNALFTNISYYNGQLEYEYNELWQEIYVTLGDKDKYNYLLSLMRELLNEDNRDTFIKDVAKSIIRDCLIKADKNALKVVGDVVSESDYNLVYLEIYLDMHCDDKKVSYFSTFTMEELKIFIEKDKRCVLLFARVIPLFDKEWNLSEYFKFILKEYSTDSDILHNLYTNIYNFSWTGRVSNYYRKVISAIESFDDCGDENIIKWKQSIISSFRKRIEKDDKEDDLREWGLLYR